MIIEVKTPGQDRRSWAPREVELGGLPSNGRELIGRLVAAELAAYAARRDERTLLEVLSPQALADGYARGRFGNEPKPTAAPPSQDEAEQAAITAYEDQLFFLFVDGVQVEDLDTPVATRTDSVVRIVRLVALAGG